MQTGQELIDFLALYFQFRNAHKWEYCGYKIFKNLIKYMTGVSDVNACRQIFEKMAKQGWFIKRKIKSRTDYIFIYNPEKVFNPT